MLAGRIEVAVGKCNKEWASLPGSPYGQRTVSLPRVIQEYRAWGGAVAGEAAPIVESKPTYVAPEVGVLGKLKEWLWQMLPTR